MKNELSKLRFKVLKAYYERIKILEKKGLKLQISTDDLIVCLARIQAGYCFIDGLSYEDYVNKHLPEEKDNDILLMLLKEAFDSFAQAGEAAVAEDIMIGLQELDFGLSMENWV